MPDREIDKTDIQNRQAESQIDRVREREVRTRSRQTDQEEKQQESHMQIDRQAERPDGQL